MQRIDAHLDGVRWAGELRGRRASAATSTRSRHGPTCSEPGATSCGASSRPASTSSAGEAGGRARRTFEGELRGDRAAPRGRARRAGPGPKAVIDHALRALEDPAIPEAAKHDVALGTELFEAVERVQERHGLVTLEPPAGDRGGPDPGAVRRLVRAVPALVGRVEGGRAAAAEARRARLRRDLPPADPPDRPHQPQGARQRADRRAGRSRLAVGDRGRDRRARGGASGPRQARGRAQPHAHRRRARDRHRARLRDPALGRPPVAEEHPEWFHRRPDGTLKYAENPPKRYQDIYNVNWDSPDWRGLWQALLEVDPPVGRLRREGVPGRQPAHQAVPVLGMADRAGPRAAIATSCSSPRRSRAGR